ncbi:AMP-binding protein, partial [Agrobacterium rhizogenes]|nr:AMP-binding protein [Rhizobium rhizogenes]
MNRKIEEILPLSPLQQGMLFHALYDDEGADPYITQDVVELAGPLNVGDLKIASDALLVRYTNLKAAFIHNDVDKPVQVIPTTVKLPWSYDDLMELEVGDREAGYKRIADADYHRRFDLSRPPLIRFSLVRMAPEKHRLILTKHHILLDGWSYPILLKDLFALYATKGDASALPRVTPYREFLAWLKKQDHQASEAAWRDAFVGFNEPTRLAPSKPTTSVVPEVVRLQLSETSTKSLRDMARLRGLTLNTVIQGSWGILLSWLSGREDVVFGINVAGRPPELAGMERMIGLFINAVPVRVQLRQGDTVASLFTRLQREQTDLMAHQYLGLAEIHRATGLPELFDTIMVYENYPIEKMRRSPEEGLQVSLLGGRGGNTTHYPLSIVVAAEKEMRLIVGYRPDLFDRETVERLGERLIRLLEAAAADPDRRLGSIELLSTPERHQVLVEWNDTAHEVPQATLPALFEAQVARTPDATALVFEDTRLSYGELNARANRLARHLIDLGVGPETIVGLCLERSVEMVVALLAVLKAGGAYLPLDPDYPADRLAFMVEDAKPLCVLT